MITTQHIYIMLSKLRERLYKTGLPYIPSVFFISYDQLGHPFWSLPNLCFIAAYYSSSKSWTPAVPAATSFRSNAFSSGSGLHVQASLNLQLFPGLSEPFCLLVSSQDARLVTACLTIFVWHEVFPGQLLLNQISLQPSVRHLAHSKYSLLFENTVDLKELLTVAENISSPSKFILLLEARGWTTSPCFPHGHMTIMLSSGLHSYKLYHLLGKPGPTER